jgi:hypothetical protein
VTAEPKVPSDGGMRGRRDQVVIFRDELLEFLQQFPLHGAGAPEVASHR